jgi:hypothetical protein
MRKESICDEGERLKGWKLTDEEGTAGAMRHDAVGDKVRGGYEGWGAGSGTDGSRGKSSKEGIKGAGLLTIMHALFGSCLATIA